MSGGVPATVKPRFFRTLVRVVSVDADGRFFTAVLPGWNWRREVRVPASSVPEGVFREVEAGKRLHAECNLDAHRPRQLRFRRWESE